MTKEEMDRRLDNLAWALEFMRNYEKKHGKEKSICLDYTRRT